MSSYLYLLAGALIVAAIVIDRFRPKPSAVISGLVPASKARLLGTLSLVFTIVGVVLAIGGFAVDHLVPG